MPLSVSSIPSGKGGFGKVNAIQRRSNNELFALKRMGKVRPPRGTGTETLTDRRALGPPLTSVVLAALSFFGVSICLFAVARCPGGGDQEGQTDVGQKHWPTVALGPTLTSWLLAALFLWLSPGVGDSHGVD